MITLIALGHKPDVWFGTVLADCFEAQLDGEFDCETTGIACLKQTLGERNVGLD